MPPFLKRMEAFFCIFAEKEISANKKDELII